MMRLKWYVMMSILGVVAISCTQTKYPSMGGGIAPAGDSIGVKVDTTRISGAVITTNGIVTNDDDAYNLVGVYNDPLFGKSTASFLTQFTLASPVDFGEDPQIDSVKLNLLFGGWYGDSLALNGLEVYQLDHAEGLSSYTDYNTNDNPSDYCSKSIKLGSLLYTATNLSIPDSTRNSAAYFPQLVVPIDKRLGEEFKDAQALGVFNSNAAFKAFFQGIYVMPTMGTKTIMKCQVEKYDVSGNAYNTSLVIYYTNEDVLYQNDTLNYTILAADSVADTLQYDLDYDGIFDLQLIKPAGGAAWSITTIDTAAGNFYTGSNTYENIKAKEFRTGVFDPNFTMRSDQLNAGDIFWVKTESQKWVKARIINVYADSIKFERTVFSGRQAFGFTSARGNAQINFEKNELLSTIDVSGLDTTKDVSVKGLGALHTKIRILANGAEMIKNEPLDKISLINRGRIIFHPTPAFAHQPNIPAFLSLGMESGTDYIPGTSYSAFLAPYVDSTNSYSFNISEYVQYLVNNPDTVPHDLILKVYNDVVDPSAVTLIKPSNDLQIIYSTY